MSIATEIQIADKLWDLIQSNTVIRFPYLGDQYLAWNELIYQFLRRDTTRNAAYQKIIQQKVKDKVVVEIGPGSRLLMTQMCVDAGAKHVYSIEGNEVAYKQAEILLNQLGLSEKITLISGLSVDVELPEQTDICLSELIGSIGNAEGVARFLNDAKRFLKPKGDMIPAGCLTWLSPCVLPTDIYRDPVLDDLTTGYAQSVYGQIGHEFPFTRYKTYNFPQENLIAPPQIFEEMWFDQPWTTEVFSKNLSFEVQHHKLLNGLVLWIHMLVDRQTRLDGFRKTNWSPVSVALDPINVAAGDVINVSCWSEIPASKFTPRYFFEVTLQRRGREIYQAVNYPDDC